MAQTRQNQRKHNQQAEYWLSSWRPYVIIILLGLAVFGSSMTFDYTHLDDTSLLVDNAANYKDLSQITNAFQTPYLKVYFRPIVSLSLILDAQVSGTLPWMYHVSNVFYHLVACCLLFLVLIELKIPRLAALCSAAFVAVCPMTVEAVAWILGRNDVLLTIFVLLSFLFFIKYEAKKKAQFFVFHIIFFVVALLTKETAIVLPMLCLYYVYFIANRKTESKLPLPYLGTWGVILLLWFLIRRSVLAGAGDTTSLSYFADNFRILFEMVGKMVVPYNLSTYPTFNLISFVTGVVVVGVMFGLMFIFRQQRFHLLVFAFLWIVFFILPGLFVIPNQEHRAQYFNYLECRSYASVIGLAIFVAGVAASLTPQLLSKLGKAGAVVILLFGVLSFSYSLSYKNGISNWTNAVTTSPNAAVAHYNLGLMWFKFENNPKLAIQSFRRAVDLEPTNYEFYGDLGLAYGRENMLDSAEAQFKKVIEMNPTHPFSYSNLGYLYMLKHDYQNAEFYLTKCYSLDSTSIRPIEQLATVYSKTKDYRKMIECMNKLQHAGVPIDRELIHIVDSLKKSSTSK